MTESEWFESADPAKMLAYLNEVTGSTYGGPAERDRKPSNRKLRLFAVACCRIAHPKPWPDLDRSNRLAEAIADGGDPAGGAALFWHTLQPDAAEAARRMVESLRDYGNADELRRISADALREIVGNPCRPLPSVRTVREYHLAGVPIRETDWTAPWLTQTAVSLAHAACDQRRRKIRCRSCSGEGCSGNIGYLDDPSERCDGSGERWFDDGTLDPLRLAVLADALEEAGCQDNAILAHLRGPGTHTRGCWCVDILTGRS